MLYRWQLSYLFMLRLDYVIFLFSTSIIEIKGFATDYLSVPCYQ